MRTYDEAVPYRTFDFGKHKQTKMKEGLEAIKSYCDKLIYREENGYPSQFDEMYLTLKIAGIAAMIGCSRHDFSQTLEIQDWREEYKSRRDYELLLVVPFLEDFI